MSSSRGALPQINMEAHGGSYIQRIVVLQPAPLHFHVNLEECNRIQMLHGLFDDLAGGFKVLEVPSNKKVAAAEAQLH